jgi:hypothetical protein
MSALLALLLKPRNLAYLFLALILGYGGYKLYSGVVDRAFEKGKTAQLKIDNPIIADAAKKQKQAEDDLAKYKGQYDTWVQDIKNTHATALAQQQAELAKAQLALNNANVSLARKESTIHELRTVVSQELGNLRLPGSVVRLWNESLEGRPADSRELGTALAASALTADNTTTDATLFDLLEAGLWNNAQAVQRGVMLGEWRFYYSTNAAAFKAHEEEVKRGAPR